MSYAICRVQKIKGASSITGIQLHNRREREHSNSNPDIDFSRSTSNYSLIGEDMTKRYNQLVEERINDGYTGAKAIRKDAVKLIEVLFTSDTEFFGSITADEERRSFEDCLQWAENRFGTDNIISAIVHNDETTPHLHIDFVPLTKDGRLCAKDFVDGRKLLQQMQDDFHQKVGVPWGLERGSRANLDDPNAPQPRKHRTTQELKEETAKTLEILGKMVVHYTKLKDKIVGEYLTEKRKFDIQEKTYKSKIAHLETEYKGYSNERFKIITEITEMKANLAKLEAICREKETHARTVLKLQEEIKHLECQRYDMQWKLDNYNGFKHSAIYQQIESWIKEAKAFEDDFIKALESWEKAIGKLDISQGEAEKEKARLALEKARKMQEMVAKQIAEKICPDDEQPHRTRGRTR
jgi:hypothetical protein